MLLRFDIVLLYLLLSLGFSGAPYNGVYKFSAVIFPVMELETKVDSLSKAAVGPFQQSRSQIGTLPIARLPLSTF